MKYHPSVEVQPAYKYIAYCKRDRDRERERERRGAKKKKVP